jgi:ABC-type multidrug transport system fused ATPase/permease subunit
MQKYQDLKEQHQSQYLKLKQQFSNLAIIRFILGVLLVILFYQFLKSQDTVFLIYCFAMLISFLIILRWHIKIKVRREIEKKLFEINNTELDYLQNNKLPFEDGKEYLDVNHLYAYDLDIFGSNSLFQHLNRTATPIGKQLLAKKLTEAIPQDEINSHQKGINELAQKIEFRQLFNAKAIIANLSNDGYDKLIQWSQKKVEIPGRLSTILHILLPTLFFVLIGLLIFTENILYNYLANTAFLFNLIFFAIYLKAIKKEIIETDKIQESIEQYAFILKLIQDETMQAPYLIKLKQALQFNGQDANQEFEKLSALFNQLSSIQNPIAALFFNGAFLYHFGVYKKLLAWKKMHGLNMEKIMHVIGEFEALNALANFSYNNPTCCFPAINNELIIDIEECGHPLIKKEKRICNDVKFSKGSFIILTGSNMSGKSTFLRTLGINMVLANAGAPVCARKANIHSLPVIVSMRMSDSLNDSESYFFAEVKRLKQIMDELNKRTCFVLLDEILKGTNSDDKRLGTMKVVEKMVQKNAIGAIATHDLEVCSISSQYPSQLSNYCFEVEIINNDLFFDYKLRAGICKNKSATFLMNKMEII